MSLKIGDQVRIQPAFGPMFQHSATVAAATLWGAPVALGMGNEAAAVVAIHDLSSAMGRIPHIAKLCVGTTTFASPTAYATVAGSSWTICASGATQTKLSYAKICMNGTGTKAIGGIDIDGTTFTLAFGGADSSILVECTVCSLTMAKLATAIKNSLPYLDTTWVKYGASTGRADCVIWPKDGNRTFNVTCTNIAPGDASVDQIGLLVAARSAMFEFKVDEMRQLMSTVSTLAYDHVAVKLTAVGGSVANISGNFIFGNERYRPNINISRSQLGTVSTAYSS